MKYFKLIAMVLLSYSCLHVNAISLLTSSSASFLFNSSSLPASVPSSGVLSLRGSSLPVVISSSPSPLNLLSASSLSSL